MIRASLLLLTFGVTSSLAQGDRPVTLGDRVQVYAPKAGYPKLTGNVVATTPDVLSLTVDRSTTEVAVPRAQIETLLLSVASQRNVKRGTVIGAVLGAGFALWFGPKEHVQGSAIETGRGSTRNLVVGSISGAALGALAGYYMKTDTWIEVSPRARYP